VQAIGAILVVLGSSLYWQYAVFVILPGLCWAIPNCIPISDTSKLSALTSVFTQFPREFFVVFSHFFLRSIDSATRRSLRF
jgi:hypothetical protein